MLEEEFCKLGRACGWPTPGRGAGLLPLAREGRSSGDSQDGCSGHGCA